MYTWYKPYSWKFPRVAILVDWRFKVFNFWRIAHALSLCAIAFNAVNVVSKFEVTNSAVSHPSVKKRKYQYTLENFPLYRKYGYLQVWYNPSHSHWSNCHTFVDTGRVLSCNVHDEESVWITVRDVLQINQVSLTCNLR